MTAVQESQTHQDPIAVRRDRAWRSIASDVTGGGAWKKAEAEGLFGAEGQTMWSVAAHLWCRVPRAMVPELSWVDAQMLRSSSTRKQREATDAWRAKQGWMTTHG